MNKHILTLFLSLTLLLSLAACGGNANTTDARRDANEIVVGIAKDLEKLTDDYCKEVERIADEKEKELMEI